MAELHTIADSAHDLEISWLSDVDVDVFESEIPGEAGWLPAPAAPAEESPDFAAIMGSGDDDGNPELLWQERALCAQTDPEAFFPEKGGSTREAKRVCSGCDVRAECLEYALANDERFGIWGGLSERERRRLRRRAG